MEEDVRTQHNGCERAGECPHPVRIYILTDNGRRAFSFSADTEVAENLSSSFVFSRVESFDLNLNRRFTQTVLSAVLHLQFFGGELK